MNYIYPICKKKYKMQLRLFEKYLIFLSEGKQLDEQFEHLV